MIAHTLTDTSVTILGPDFAPRTMAHTHPAFETVVEAIKNDDEATIAKLMDLPSAVVDFMQGRVQISDRTLYYDGRPLDSALTRRILQFMDAGNPELAKPLVAFLDKVMENTSRRAVVGLYEWCEKSGLPITPEGDILAWKIVTNDYKDIHSRSFNNSVGQTVEVGRNEVDEDPDRTCSYGLHFCSTAYLPHFGSYGQGGREDRVMVLRIHPADVVAFPRDYNTSKGRCCRYEVIGQVPPAKAKEFFPSIVADIDFERTVGGEIVDELELDRLYRTRDGRVVEIISYDEDADDSGDEYPFLGRLTDTDEEEHFSHYGSWNLYNEHPLDLVEELPEDFDPVRDRRPAPEQPRGLFNWLFSR